MLLAILMCVPIVLASCKKNAPDTDDSNSSATDTALILIGDSAQTYTIVRPDNSDDNEMDAAKLIRSHFQKSGVEIAITSDWKDNPISEYEIVIGDTTRDDTDDGIDISSFGLSAGEYLIKVNKSRIYIVGGTSTDTLTATEYFLSQFFGYGGDPNNISAVTSVSVPGDYEYLVEIETTSLTLSIAGKPLSEFVIAYGDNISSSQAGIYAYKLQNFLSENAKYGLQIVGNVPSSSAIIFSGTSEANKTFTVKVENGNLIISCDMLEGFGIGLNRFFREKLSIDGELNLDNGFNYKVDLMEKITYMDLGAKGDGKTDDLKAIIATHEYANKYNVPVKADEGKTFYIGVCSKGAVIKTNTDFTGASFIIDDQKLSMDQRGVPIFTVASNKEAYELSTLKQLSIGQTNIGITLPEDSLIIVTEAGTKRYIRKGYNADNDGADQNEALIVDKNGNISADSPVIWDYTNITSAKVLPIDTETLTIKGGTFTTVANNKVTVSGYYKRGFLINRSNVTVEGVTHYIENEGIDGAPYDGFMVMQECCNITLKDCTFTPHRTFYWTNNEGIHTSVGTYDILPKRVVNLTMKNCKQSIDIMDNKYWGIIGTNFCKNIVMDGCELSRMDAHQGVHNAKILNSTIGYLGISIIGSGELLVKNSTLHGDSLINLRDDYGSTWQGDVIIKDCTWKPGKGAWLSGEYYSIIGGSNLQNHNFGYECYMPANITIEKLHIDDSKAMTSYKGIYLFENINPSRTSESAENSMTYKYHVTETVNISGLTIASGKALKTSANEFMFRDVDVNIS